MALPGRAPRPGADAPSGGPLPARVLHVVQPVEGGVARVVAELVRAQRRSGIDVHLVCPEGGTLADTARRYGASAYTWRADREPGVSLYRETADLGQLLDRVRPGLVHAHSAKAGLAARLAVRGRLPTVFQPHAWSFEAVDGTVAALARRWERYAARWADHVVCVSEAERRTGLAAGVRARWAVVPNGVDLTAFRPGGPRYAFADGAPLVVCVGRLCRQKGQDVLLRAWPAVRRAVPDARLVLAGAGPDEEALRRAAPEGVTFVGATEDAARWYRAADLVVQPSRWEGMALAPLEAMACGRAVVLTEVGGARESLPPLDAAHCLVPPADAPALAVRLVSLLEDTPLRAALAGRALRHVRAAHDVRDTTARTTELYRSPRPRPYGEAGPEPDTGAATAPGDRTTPPGPRAVRARTPEHREPTTT
ncbi:glycosyltransferase [Streptomyces sp. NPDC007088]|uniref:glycosyltransferase n=1 Tax=Streptomyces sp. NPDC007088 TaxID=3364773 RepID=UPI0036A23890